MHLLFTLLIAIFATVYARSRSLSHHQKDKRAQSADYAIRYWQEAGFRDLKSDGWHWQPSRIWSPDHANRRLLVLALATAWMRTLGTVAFDALDLKIHFTKGHVQTYSRFRLGLRFVEALLDHSAPVAWPLPPFICLSAPRSLPLRVGV